MDGIFFSRFSVISTVLPFFSFTFRLNFTIASFVSRSSYCRSFEWYIYTSRILFLLLFHSKNHRRGKGLIKYDYGGERERERSVDVGDVERRDRSA